jgi:membrane protein implicated in regulation of membrane protease activity
VSFLSSLLVWANVPYLVALGIAVLFALLQASGLLGLLAGGDQDADADHEADVDADADADADTDADADGDHDAEHEGDADHAHEGSPVHAFFVDLGVGRVPMSILWQTFAASFGFAGLALNILFRPKDSGALPSSLAWTLPISLVFGYLITRTLSRTLARVLADPKQEATSRKQLVGHTGVVISSKVSPEFGEVRVHDKTGHVLRIICRMREGERPILEGREVVIVEHDAARDWLLVAPLDDDGPDEKVRVSKGDALAVEEADALSEEAGAQAEKERRAL